MSGKTTAVWVLQLLLGIASATEEIEEQFMNPPDSARPWVYWMFMDGNLTREGMTADLEAMNRAGIGGVIIMEVNIGIPRGTVDFMSEQWRGLIKHAVSEAERLGLEVALSAGPGWCGTGGPWVKPEQSMQHLVASETKVKGPVKFDAVLPRPKPRKPFFGERTLTPELKKIWEDFYLDVTVLAFPAPAGDYRIPAVDEKALYFRAPYTSQPGVKPYLMADKMVLPSGQCINPEKVVELSGKMSSDGRLSWDVPDGDWTIMRFGRTITGQTTRPAPLPGLGFESDKFDKAAIDAHFENFVGALLKTVGEPSHRNRGLTTVHFDSWEMGSQNWSENFRKEFKKRRGYDLQRFLPAMLGYAVESVDVSERFLWDFRKTAQELVIENHALRLKKLGRKHGMIMSIEPYDLNPAGDLELGGVADVPMCEFWSRGYGFNSDFSCFEAVSAAHTAGRNIVGAEAFTSSGDGWKQHPASMKAQGDWALCVGINRFVFHRYQHQPWLDRFPGMTFGPYGVYWERTQTWWNMAHAYHSYLARCQFMLRRGLPVADVLYLDLEGAPNVFRPPASAMLPGLPDKRGYSFDGCAPSALIERASVRKGRIVLDDGTSYRLLVLPRAETMTPGLLRKIRKLADAGARIIGVPPDRSPGLENYPECDSEVKRLAAEIWSNKSVVRDSPVSVVQPGRALCDARWIWHREGNPAASAPVCKRFFRREVEIAGDVVSASLTMTADNSFEVSVNGKAAGSGNNFHNQYEMDVKPLLKQGLNVISVIAENGGDAPNPAGLVAALSVRMRDGRTLSVATDGQWKSAVQPDGDWDTVIELGEWKMPPWNLKEKPVFPDIYPPYETTARILSDMNVPPDFESEEDLRYIHRQDGDVDIYFVGNRSDVTVTAVCRFRVMERQPELWDPMTGEIRVLPECEDKDGRTSVPLRFEPMQSWFVVFKDRIQKPESSSQKQNQNFLELKPVMEIMGPWAVMFDPKWGGPDKTVIFDRLVSWTERPEEEIKYYSGTAVYRKVFDLAAVSSESLIVKGKEGTSNHEQIANNSTRLWLDLGGVKNMAEVKINDHNLGVVWCPPWRVAVPAGLLKEQGNNLEITVANLWCNRLIADSALPVEKKMTWTTHNPFKPDAQPQESGLFGLVRLLTTE